jgi:hypothetical protein
MSYCGQRPGMCGGKADCGDAYCPGRPEATPFRWVNGSESVDNGLMTSLHRIPADEPLTTPGQAIDWTEFALWGGIAAVFALFTYIFIVGWL